MSAARRHLGLRTAHWRRRGERLLVFVGVLLPIPLFAASGLSLPLPASVERLAAALVPWAEATTDGNQLLARGPGGSIVRLGGERHEGISYALGKSAPADEKLGAAGDRNAPGKNGGTGPSVEGGEEGKPAEGGGVDEQPATQDPVKNDPARDEPIRGNDPTPPLPLPPPPPPPPDPVEIVDRTVDPIREIVPIIPPVPPVHTPVLPGLGQ